jgi:hypothetical protein
MILNRYHIFKSNHLAFQNALRVIFEKVRQGFRVDPRIFIFFPNIIVL